MRFSASRRAENGSRFSFGETSAKTFDDIGNAYRDVVKTDISDAGNFFFPSDEKSRGFPDISRFDERFAELSEKRERKG